MQKSDWQLIMELKKTFEIIWTHKWLTDSRSQTTPVHTYKRYTLYTPKGHVIMESSVLLIHLRTFVLWHSALHSPVSRTCSSRVHGRKLTPLPFSSSCFCVVGSVGDQKKKKDGKKRKQGKKCFSVRNWNYYHCFKQWQMLENVRQPLQLFQMCLFSLINPGVFFLFCFPTISKFIVWLD